MYVWSKRAFGEFPGFMTGWTYWTSNLPYFPAVLYFAASNALYIGPRSWLALSNNKTYFLIFALCGLIARDVSECHRAFRREMAAQSGRDGHLAADRDSFRDRGRGVAPIRVGDTVHGGDA